MNLSFVEVAGFRGFKSKARFNFSRGFVVLTGRNGAGKSTVLDAIDFAVTGTINKFSVTEAKGGGLGNHIWWVGDGVPDEQYVEVGFLDDEGRETILRRTRERGLETTATDLSSRFWIGDAPESWQEILMRTSLIRDETIAGLSLDLPEQARFAAVRAAIGGLAGPQHTKRTSEILQAANSASTEQRARVAEARSSLGNALNALTEARSAAQRQDDVARAQQIIQSLAPDLAALPGDRGEALRRLVAQRKQSIAAVGVAVSRAADAAADWRHFHTEPGQAEVAAARDRRGTALKSKEQAEKDLVEAEQIERTEGTGDTVGDRLAALLEHGAAIGLHDGRCPLCAAARSPEEFSAAIEAARLTLSAQVAKATRAAEATKHARTLASAAAAELTQASQHLESLEDRRRESAETMERAAAALGQWGFSFSPTALEASQEALLRRQEETAELERSLFILEASSTYDRVTALEESVERLRKRADGETAKLSDVERAVEAARQIDTAAKEVGNQVLTEQFDTVMPLLKELYQRLRPHTDWREIEIDFGGRVRASLNFTVGDGRNPQFLFSSGQRRAAGVAFLLAVHLSRAWCRLDSLLLDDPVQHIDDYRALNLVEVLSAIRRNGRQVVVAVEDPALADVLCRRLRSSAGASGRRFELATATTGSSTIVREDEILPLPHAVLDAREAS
jgi:DNA repair exonuclease SbcCD ATPase subunit